jgi:hypothetical protein
MRALTLGVAFLASFLVMQVGLYVLNGVVVELDRGKLALGAIPGLLLEATLRSMSGLTAVSSDRDSEVLLWLPIPAALALAQVAFISPLVGPLRLAPTGRSMRWTVIGASVMVGGLTCILLWSILQAIELAAQVSQPRAYTDNGPVARMWRTPHVLYSAWFACGALWTWALRRSIASRDPDTISRFARRMLAGTCVELVLALPLYLLVRKRTQCMCATPNFWSIVVGLLGLVWLCGPAGVLLLTRSARRRWRAGACARCGYPLRAGSARCSECGHEARCRS